MTLNTMSSNKEILDMKKTEILRVLSRHYRMAKVYVFFNYYDDSYRAVIARPDKEYEIKKKFLLIDVANTRDWGEAEAHQLIRRFDKMILDEWTGDDYTFRE